ncbi:hypothetical protein ACNI3K_04765 [Demequina sp. SO4-13]|uniref:hypothetical protein n=1 Tax=Demequina sp. SO4-13 TaxID=3401027 RepID=UPI003AF4CD1B
MSDTTPDPPASSAGKGKAKKAPARKSVSGTAPDSSPEVVATPDPEPAPASAAPSATADAEGRNPRRGRSVLDGVRDNHVGPLAAGLLVAIAVGLLLSVLVPSQPSVLAMAILGTLLSASVGFAVRFLSVERGMRRQIEAFLATIVGVHLMSVTGAVGGEIPVLGQLGIGGPGFNEALLVAFATPAISTGALLAGLSAVIIVGWGRPRTHEEHSVS